MRLAIVLLAAALVSPVAAQTQRADPQSAEAVARALQENYDRVRDFTADFVHRYQGVVLRQTAVERGQLLVKKPGKMRWDYNAPERKLFVSDGRKLYSYLPQDKQVIVSDVPTEDHATTPALFLTGKGNLLRDFTVSFGQAVDTLAGTTVLKLVPRRSEAEYDWLMLAVDPRSLQIRTLITVDGQGGKSTFTFTNLKENVGLADKEFAFTMPRGVDVVVDRAASQ